MLLAPPAAGYPASWLPIEEVVLPDPAGVAVESLEKVPVAAAAPLRPASTTTAATTYGMMPRFRSDVRSCSMYQDSRSAGGPVRKTRSASISRVLALTPFGEVLEAGEIKVDPLLDPIGPLAGLFQGLTVVAELHSNLGSVLLSWLKIRSASLGFAQLLG